MIYVGLEEQQRRRIGRFFRPALKLMHGVAEYAWANQTHEKADSYETKSIELKRLGALAEIAARFRVLGVPREITEMA
jgi:hypothetical protein